MPAFTIRSRSPAPSGFRHGAVKNPAFYARRAALSGAIVGGHLLVVLWALYSGGVITVPKVEQRLVSVDISVATEQSLPAKPAKAPRISPDRAVQLLLTESTLPMPPTAAGSGTGEGCAMAATVAQAIVESPDAMAALASLPSGLRTKADAVMLWNGTWMPDDEQSTVPFLAPNHPMQPVRRVVLEALRASPPECQNVETAGPQLIPIAEPGRTTMLVVGSGVWRWSSMIDPLTDAPSELGELQAGSLWPLKFPPTGN